MAKHKYFDKRIEAVQQKWIDVVVNKLANEGQKIIDEAYKSANNGSHTLDWGDTDEYGIPSDYYDTAQTVFTPPKWKNLTGNLRDAYGSAVYVYGKVQKSSLRFIGGETATHFLVGDIYEDFRGRDAITEYLLSYRGNVKSVIEFICVNAAPHAGALEWGETWGSNKYFVISQMTDEMEDINKRIVAPLKYKSGVKQIGLF